MKKVAAYKKRKKLREQKPPEDDGISKFKEEQRLLTYDNSGKSQTEKTLILVTLAIFVLGYLIPMLIIQRPFGTDDYTHIIYSDYFKNVGTMQGFYDELSLLNSRKELEFGVYSNYPFGLWLLGSLISKISGLDVFTVSLVTPILLLVSIILMFYVYSLNFLGSKKDSLISVGFLLSMPVVSTFLLSYRPSVVVLPLLMLAFYFALKYEKLSRNEQLKGLGLSIIAIFFICITHTGTYMFLMLFAIVYTIIYAILSGRLHKGMFALILGILFIYSFTLGVFPEIKAQYTDKATLLLMAGDFVNSKTHITIVSELGNLFYNEIFVAGDITYVILWSAFFYAFIGLIIYLRSLISPAHKLNGDNRLNVTLPIIGSINKLPTNILGSPFWMGPLQSILIIPGFFKLDKSGKSALLTVLLVTFIPGALSMGSTGAIREIYYVLVIVPIASTLGFYWVLRNLDGLFKRGKTMVATLFVSVIFALFIITPIVSNLYYLQITAGSDYEINSMKWLSQVGDNSEKSLGFGYRQISTYSNKPLVDYEHGTETNKITDDVERVYFYNNSEAYARDLYDYFGAKYLISSSRVIDNAVALSGFSGDSKQTYIDSNTELDKIQSSMDFGIYSAIKYSNKTSGTNYVEDASRINYDKLPPKLIDKGSVYYVETLKYRVIIDKEKPVIRYLGDKSTDFLSGSYQQDSLLLTWYSGEYNSKYLSDNLEGFTYPVTEAQSNTLKYITYLKDGDGTLWSTLIVKYTFYENTIRKEVILSNDGISFNSSNMLRIEFNTLYGLPVSVFNYGFNNAQEQRRYVYPSEDYVILRENKFNEVFFDGGDKGLYIRSGENSVYPSEIKYKGSIGTTVNYSYVNIKTSGFLQPADSMHIVSYLSIGQFDNAKEDVDNYLDVSLYPYPHGKTPVVFVSYLKDLTPFSETSSWNPFNVYSSLDNLSINYAEALPLEKEDTDRYELKKLNNYNLSLMGYMDIYNRSNNLFYNDELQKEKIKNMVENAEENGLKINGLFIDSLNSNLGTIKAADDEKMNFLFTGVPESGIKTPRFAYYHGNETNLLLMPVSQLDFGTGSVQDIFSSLNNSIDDARDSEDALVYLWRSENMADVLNYENDNFTSAIESTYGKPAYFSNPDMLSSYLRLMRNVYANISKDNNFIILDVLNQNNESMEGVTFKIVLPVIDHGCDGYLIENGILERRVNEGATCTLFVSTNLEANESKVMRVKTTTTTDKLSTKMVKGPIEGEIIFLVSTQNNKLIKDTTVFINDQRYLPDDKGYVKANLSRGQYVISIEKPGFETQSYAFEVKSKSYYVESIFPWIVGVLAVVLIFFAVNRRR